MDSITHFFGRRRRLNPYSSKAKPSAESAYTRLLKLFEDQHAALRIRTLDEDPMWRVRQNEYKDHPPPSDFIRVAFYDDITKLYRDIEPDIESFVRLPPSGGLDLRKLRRQWGLETCAPIHPMKWKVEHPSDPDWMSALAVYNNTDRVRCIKFTEPTVSRLTVYQRRLRACILMLLQPVIRFPLPTMSNEQWDNILVALTLCLFLCFLGWIWYYDIVSFPQFFFNLKILLRRAARNAHVRF
ncbi:hypothetical protein CPB85DRAFT_1304749 [Mucidula mucida]|nr:hypothetical protein CPB85DRAFT_1304749 [Mucidula mucida]